MTRGVAQAFKNRWEVVNTAEKKEFASTPMAEKFRQLAVLLTSEGKLGWKRNREAEEAQVRDRWVRLRSVYHTRTGGFAPLLGVLETLEDRVKVPHSFPPPPSSLRPHF